MIFYIWMFIWALLIVDGVDMFIACVTKNRK